MEYGINKAHKSSPDEAPALLITLKKTFICVIWVNFTGLPFNDGTLYIVVTRHKRRTYLGGCCSKVSSNSVLKKKSYNL